jgi:hypothetical protein
MKKIFALFVIMMFISSMVVVADDTSEDEGFSLWEFLFGSSEDRALAGTAWFDRSDLPLATGMAEHMVLTGPTLEGPHATWTLREKDGAVEKLVKGEWFIFKFQKDESLQSFSSFAELTSYLSELPTGGSYDLKPSAPTAIIPGVKAGAADEASGDTTEKEYPEIKTVVKGTLFKDATHAEKHGFKVFDGSGWTKEGQKYTISDGKITSITPKVTLGSSVELEKDQALAMGLKWEAGEQNVGGKLVTLTIDGGKATVGAFKDFTPIEAGKKFRTEEKAAREITFGEWNGIDGKLVKVGADGTIIEVQSKPTTYVLAAGTKVPMSKLTAMGGELVTASGKTYVKMPDQSYIQVSGNSGDVDVVLPNFKIDIKTGAKLSTAQLGLAKLKLGVDTQLSEDGNSIIGIKEVDTTEGKRYELTVTPNPTSTGNIDPTLQASMGIDGVAVGASKTVGDYEYTRVDDKKFTVKKVASTGTKAPSRKPSTTSTFSYDSEGTDILVKKGTTIIGRYKLQPQTFGKDKLPIYKTNDGELFIPDGEGGFDLVVESKGEYVYAQRVSGKSQPCKDPSKPCGGSSTYVTGTTDVKKGVKILFDADGKPIIPSTTVAAAAASEPKKTDVSENWGSTFGLEEDLTKLGEGTVQAMAEYKDLSRKQELHDSYKVYDSKQEDLVHEAAQAKKEVVTAKQAIIVKFETFAEKASAVGDIPTESRIMDPLGSEGEFLVAAKNTQLHLLSDTEILEYRKLLIAHQDASKAYTEKDRIVDAYVDFEFSTAKDTELKDKAAEYGIDYDQVKEKVKVKKGSEPTLAEIKKALGEELVLLKKATTDYEGDLTGARDKVDGLRPIPMSIEGCKIDTNCRYVEKTVKGVPKTVMYLEFGNKIYEFIGDAGIDTNTLIDPAGYLKGFELPTGAKVVWKESMRTANFGAITYKEKVGSKEELSTVISTSEDKKITMSNEVYKRLGVSETDIMDIKDDKIIIKGAAPGQPTRSAEFIKVGGQTVATHISMPVAVEGEEGKLQNQLTVLDDQNRVMYTQTDAQRDGEKRTISSGGQILEVLPEHFDSKSGFCKSDKACLKGTSGKFEGLEVMAAGNNPMDAVPAIRKRSGCATPDCNTLEAGEDSMTETWSYTLEDGTKVTYKRKCEKKECDEDSFVSDTYDSDAFFGTESRTTKVTVGKGTSDEKEVIRREYNSQVVSLFSYVDGGTGFGKDCLTSKDCGGNQVFFSADNDYACPTEPCNEKTEDKVKTSSPDWQETICEGLDESCSGSVTQTHDTIGVDLFFAGKQEWQIRAGAIFDINQGWNSISMALLGDTYAKEWSASIDRWFSGMVLNKDYIASSVCYDKHGDISSDSDGFAFIETPSGTFQPVASIQAEVLKEETPLLCMISEDEEGEVEYVCPSELYCNEEDQFCYKDEGDETPEEGYVYKITWGVSAPYDEALTPYSDENGHSVTFEIVLRTGGDDVSLYNKPIQLKNGETDHDTFIHYSDSSYKSSKFCIDWINPPLTMARQLKDSTESGLKWGSRGVKDVCFDVVETEKGEKSVDYSGSSSSPKQTVSGGEISRNSDW